MNQEYFIGQIDRLKIKFGTGNFCSEFVDLVWKDAAQSMSILWLKQSVDKWIGERPVNKPPRRSDFVEAMHAERKYNLKNRPRDTRTSEQVNAKPIAEVLQPHFGKVESVGDAFEIARLKKKIEPNDDGSGPGAA